MNWSVGVTTAPRRQPTLQRCLKSLDSAGWPEYRIFAEPGSEIPPGIQDTAMSLRDVCLGPWPNWFLGLSELFQRSPHADAYMLVQDDAVFCRNARPCLERLSWNRPDVGVVSPYCPSDYGRSSVGLHPVNADWRLTGAVALIFTADSVEEFLTYAPAVTYRRDDKHGGMKHIDSLVGRWAQATERSILCFSPSLVQHIGETSTIGNTETASGGRYASSFVGENVDALSLICGEALDPGDRSSEPNRHGLTAGKSRIPAIEPPKDVPPFHDFTISRHCWETIRHLVRPGVSTLECGSGLSTLLFEAAGCVHTALEHDPSYQAPAASAQVRPLTGNPRWYDWEPAHAYDLIFIDGPPEAIGRSGILRVIRQCVHAQSIIVVDDTHRAAEQHLLKQILELVPRTPINYHGDRRDFVICYPPS